MADEKPPRRQDSSLTPELLTSIAEALQRSNDLVASQAETIERLNANSQAQAQAIADLQAQLAKKPAPAPAPAQRAVVPTVPYEGYVRAREACYIGSLRQPGEVFYVKVSGLWTDDPYEPVTVDGTDRDGTPIYRTNEKVRSQHFTLRPRTSEALAALNATPRKASDWENTDKAAAAPADPIAPPDPASAVSP